MTRRNPSFEELYELSPRIGSMCVIPVVIFTIVGSGAAFCRKPWTTEIAPRTLVIYPSHHSSSGAETTGAFLGSTPAFDTRIFGEPTVFRTSSNTVCTALLSLTLAENVCTFVPGYLASRPVLLLSRFCRLRPMRIKSEAPAAAKEDAMLAPMPLAPPVIATILPFADREGCVGLIAA